MTTETTTDITALPPADRALIVLESTKTEDHLKALVVEAQPITEVTNPAGREQAHSIGMKMRKARTTIEKTGKTAREDAQAFSKAVIAEEKRLIGIIEGEEKRVLGLRDGYDAKVEAEKAERARVEAERVAAIQEKITGLRNLPLALAGESSEVIAAELQALSEFEPSEAAFAEFTAGCATARHEVMGALRELHDRVKAQEEANARALAEAEAAKEAQRKADEALAAERAAIQAERDAIAREREEIARQRAELEASKVQAVVEPVAAPLVPVEVGQVDRFEIIEGDNPDFVLHGKDEETQTNVAEEHTQPTQAATDWKIRQFALATADQFAALAGKVDLCGVSLFASQLRAASENIRNGVFDAVLSGADTTELVRFDNDMLDATVAAIDAITA